MKSQKSRKGCPPHIFTMPPNSNSFKICHANKLHQDFEGCPTTPNLDSFKPIPAKEAWYFMRIGKSFKRKDITSESMTLKGSMDVDPALRQALTDADEGIMRPGALPKMQTNSANGNKQLLDALEKAQPWGWQRGFIAGAIQLVKNLTNTCLSNIQECTLGGLKPQASSQQDP